MVNYYVALKYLFKLFLDFCLLVENPRYNVFTDQYVCLELFRYSITQTAGHGKHLYPDCCKYLYIV